MVAGPRASSWSWLVGALAIGAAIPWTLLVIRPINRRLLGSEPLADAEIATLRGRWGRWHAAHTAFGAVAPLAFLLAVGRR